jgi:hypothetical protein
MAMSISSSGPKDCVYYSENMIAAIGHISFV